MEHLSNQNNTIEYLVVCKCTNMPKFAQEAYKLLYPDKECPSLYAGPMKIGMLASQYDGSEFKEYLMGLTRSKEKFAYLFEVSENGDIISLTNLKTGGKVL